MKVLDWVLEVHGNALYNSAVNLPLISHQNVTPTYFLYSNYIQFFYVKI